MFIKEIRFKDYLMFRDKNIEFDYPSQNENKINIVFGLNGTGKTKLLNFIFEFPGYQKEIQTAASLYTPNSIRIVIDNNNVLADEISIGNKITDINARKTKERVCFFTL